MTLYFRRHEDGLVHAFARASLPEEARTGYRFLSLCGQVGLHAVGDASFRDVEATCGGCLAAMRGDSLLPLTLSQLARHVVAHVGRKS